MSLAGAFSSAASMPGEDRVDSKGEFSLVRVCSRSERPLFVAAVPVAAGLEEAMDPINAFLIYIGSQGQSFSSLRRKSEKTACLGARLTGLIALQEPRP